VLCGPLRRPRQMLAEQRYDGHTSIHDDAMAENLGLRAGPIDGETGALVAEMILNHAVMKASYAAYDREAAEPGRSR
ncbi:MAG TPA: hypothetical protein VHT91_13290, partial [Kofleriaceae bacterium]|nr:hypothetical protein [Kofleriaceae bacterium]